MITFGGPDRVSIELAASFPNGLFISPFVDSSDPDLRQFIIDQYFTNGAALFGRESSEEIEAFRQAAGLRPVFKDPQVYEMIQYFVQRVRNYAHLETLFIAEIEAATVAIGDRDPRCLKYANKTLFVDGCMKNLDWFRSLSHEEYMNEVYGKDWGFPPFHTLCTCTINGVIEGVSED